jgi:beta-glucosidase
LHGLGRGDVVVRVGQEGDLAIISSPVDFVGITYYLSMEVAGAGEPEVVPTSSEAARSAEAEIVDQAIENLPLLLQARITPVSGPVTGLGWPVHPEGITRLLCWIRDRYGNPPIILTENGAAYEDIVAEDGTVDDPERIAYLRDHFVAAHAAIEQGVDLRGWYVWSFMDTWEFSLGSSGRFGLVHVDYDTQKRTIKSSGHWFRDVMKNNGFEAP